MLMSPAAMMPSEGAWLPGADAALRVIGPSMVIGPLSAAMVIFWRTVPCRRRAVVPR